MGICVYTEINSTFLGWELSKCKNEIIDNRIIVMKAPITFKCIIWFIIGIIINSCDSSKVEEIKITKELANAVQKYDALGSFKEGLAPVEKDEKWGCINKNGKEVIPCIYDYIWDISEEYVCVIKDEKYGYVDRQGKEILPCIYDGISIFSENIVSVIKDGKVGYIDKNGKEITPCIYEDGGDFFNGIAKVKENGKYGYINSKGEEIIPCIYNYVSNNILDGLRCVKKDGKYGYIDNQAKIVIQCMYDFATDFSEGIARVGIEGKVGYINKSGKVIVPIIYNEIGRFSDGIAYVRKDNFYTYVNMDGEEVGPNFNLPSRSSLLDYFDGINVIASSNRMMQTKYGIVDMGGKEIAPCIYDYYSNSHLDGLIFVKYRNKWGCLDKNGNEILPYIYDDLYKMEESDKFIIGEKNGRYELIDKTGKIVVPYISDYSPQFSEGLAPVRRNGKWGYIDIDGNEIIPCIYDNAWKFSDGSATVKKDGKYGQINQEGKEIIPCIYENMSDRFSEGLIYAVKDGKYGYIDKYGNSTFSIVNLNNEKSKQNTSNKYDENFYLENMPKMQKMIGIPEKGINYYALLDLNKDGNNEFFLTDKEKFTIYAFTVIDNKIICIGRGWWSKDSTINGKLFSYLVFKKDKKDWEVLCFTAIDNNEIIKCFSNESDLCSIGDKICTYDEFNRYLSKYEGEKRAFKWETLPEEYLEYFSVLENENVDKYQSNNNNISSMQNLADIWCLDEIVYTDLENELLRGKVQKIIWSNERQSYTLTFNLDGNYDSFEGNTSTLINSYPSTPRYFIEGKIFNKYSYPRFPCIPMDFEGILSSRGHNYSDFSAPYASNHIVNKIKYEYKDNKLFYARTEKGFLEYQYDKNGFLKQRLENHLPCLQIERQGNAISKISFYDENGHFSCGYQMTFFDNSIRIKLDGGNEAIFKFDANGKIISCTHKMLSDSSESFYFYDNKGRISRVSQKFMGINGEYSNEENIEYDQYSNITAILYGDKKNGYRFKYSYDNSGNWIKKDIYKMIIGDIEIEKKVGTETRKIEYYE